jgi:hypothetical protein
MQTTVVSLLAAAAGFSHAPLRLTFILRVRLRQAFKNKLIYASLPRSFVRKAQAARTKRLGLCERIR